MNRDSPRMSLICTVTEPVPTLFLLPDSSQWESLIPHAKILVQLKGCCCRLLFLKSCHLVHKIRKLVLIFSTDKVDKRIINKYLTFCVRIIEHHLTLLSASSWSRSIAFTMTWFLPSLHDRVISSWPFYRIHVSQITDSHSSDHQYKPISN